MKNTMLDKGSIILLVFLISSCTGTQAAANEVWSMVDLVTQGEDIYSITETVEVRNCCDVVENKTRTCTAGTSNDLSLDIGVNIGPDEMFSVEPGVAASLGFNRSGEETVELQPPPTGYIYIYRVTTTYSIIAGEAIIRSSNGVNKNTAYRFQAGCSLNIEPNPELVMCELCLSEEEPKSTVTKSVITTTRLSPTQVPLPSMTNFTACQDLCDGTNASSVFPEGSTKLFIEWDFANIPDGAKYTRVWTMDGKEWVKYECIWNGNLSGHDSVVLREPYGLHSGIWEVTITVDNVIVLREQVEVLGEWDYWAPAGTFFSCYDNPK